MELILTSFGLSHFPRRDTDIHDIFYRMPPVSMSVANLRFIPDYAVLLLCDHVILDSKSVEGLSDPWQYRGYEEVAEIVKVLSDEGFTRIVDFDAIVGSNRELLKQMLERDLRRLEDWIQPLKESMQTWQDFVASIEDLLHRDIINDRGDMMTDKVDTQEENVERKAMYRRAMGYVHILHNMSATSILRLEEALDSSRKRRQSKYKDILRTVLTEYLAYVNANLVLSNTLGVGFHDWYDFRPFYREKFLSVGREKTPEGQRIEKVKQLFEVSFPEFTFWDTKQVVRALKDKRISDLRTLVDKAAKGDVEFDHEFANRVLHEVLGIEQRIGRIRNIVSYLTLPLDFLPWGGTLVQKGVEELAGRVIESKMKKEFRWFYMISELAEHSRSHLSKRRRTNKKDSV